MTPIALLNTDTNAAIVTNPNATLVTIEISSGTSIVCQQQVIVCRQASNGQMSPVHCSNRSRIGQWGLTSVSIGGETSASSDIAISR